MPKRMNILSKNKWSLIIAAAYGVLAMTAILFIYDWQAMLWTLLGVFVAMINMVLTLLITSKPQTNGGGALWIYLPMFLRLFILVGVVLIAYFVTPANRQIAVLLSLAAGLNANAVGLLLGLLPAFKKQDEGSEM